ncbi:hypothetical protein TNCV_4839211 [Trichonephila clavipes]|nr:hypothetical protein TNCV_4839211 [Trichonephila clavipes]
MDEGGSNGLRDSGVELLLYFFSEKGSPCKLTLQPIAMLNPKSRNPIDPCLNEATPPPTSQANSNIVVSR